jgi:hypothetical protein
MQITLRPVTIMTLEIKLEVESEYMYDDVVEHLTKKLDEMNNPLITTNPHIVFNVKGTTVALEKGMTLRDIVVQNGDVGVFAERISLDDIGNLVYQASAPYDTRRRGPWINKLSPQRKKVWLSMSNHPVHAKNPLSLDQPRGAIDSRLFKMGGNNKHKRSKRTVSKKNISKRKISKRKISKRKISKRKISKRRFLRIRRT